MDIDMPGQVSIQCGGHKASVVQLSYSRNFGSGYYLASAGHDGLAMLRHGSTGLWIGSVEGHEEAVTGVCLNWDATLLATSSDDATARIWDAGTGTQVKVFPHPGEVNCVQLDASSKRLVTGCRDPNNCVSVFDVERSDRTPLESYLGHTRGVRNAIFCREDRALLTASYDRTVRMWDRQSGLETNSIELPHHAKSLELHPDGKTVTLAYGSSLVFLDVDKFEVLHHHKMGYKVAGATLNPSKNTFVCAGRTGHVCKYEFSSVELLDIYSLKGVCCVTFSPDGEMCACSSDTGQITLWHQRSPWDDWE